jgi:hypothetical protein
MENPVPKSKPVFNCCPHCGSDEGLYRRETLANVNYRFGYDGKAQDNSEMYDSATVHEGKIAYCITCRKQVCKVSTIEKYTGITI